MQSISQVDRNFVVQTSLNIENIRFYNILDERFSLYGVFLENGRYRRLPEKVAKSVSEGVYNLHAHTAGGRVKFITDSKYIAIKAIMPEITKIPHCPLTCSAGFDLYRHNFAAHGYIQRYDRLENLLDPKYMPRGTVHGADSYLIDAPAMWKAALDMMRKNEVYFVEKREQA